MRIATYNVEWFTNLFNRDDELLVDDGWSGRQNVTRAAQIEALAKVFVAIDADAVMVIEAPDSNGRRSTVKALENFARAFELRTTRALIGFVNNTQQEIALLYDPNVCRVRHDPRGDSADSHLPDAAPRFEGTFRMDLDTDAVHESIEFSKPPLEVELIAPTGRKLRLIGVHVKSKVPHGARSQKARVRLAIENRRKQLAQCIWIRRRVEGHLDAGEPVIVMGDFNDGPGLDEYENLFGHSGVEVVMGCDGSDRRQLFDPAAMETLSRRSALRPSTSRFLLQDRGFYMNALLDYIMVSPDLRKLKPHWEIWHPFDNPKCFDALELREALLTASDHFPVTLDIRV